MARCNHAECNVYRRIMQRSGRNHAIAITSYGVTDVLSFCLRPAKRNQRDCLRDCTALSPNLRLAVICIPKEKFLIWNFYNKDYIIIIHGFQHLSKDLLCVIPPGSNPHTFIWVLLLYSMQKALSQFFLWIGLISYYCLVSSSASSLCLSAKWTATPHRTIAQTETATMVLMIFIVSSLLVEFIFAVCGCNHVVDPMGVEPMSEKPIYLPYLRDRLLISVLLTVPQQPKE